MSRDLDSRTSGPPSVRELRLRLEGAWELVEEGHARHVALLRGLKWPWWRTLLRARPELLQEVIAGAAVFADALERAELLPRTLVDGNLDQLVDGHQPG